ncbi:calcium/sodium antiporter [Rubellicoccus peritrichatus]|uniref:Calcium/sodium antiporter n=1 Tax=Rubellicoccus peritrichatus TaxID=3080537 RepID=A0AAQ3LEW7_9BACT|nr:calcium/sodium antiporter [Puniceicoccus sp. CR14]WOO42388.1 calcium/sodium antiporter [Puniceicoccus sp. CR14]
MLDYTSFSTLLLIVFLIVGLVLLCFGGDWLAKGASGLALKLDINPVVVGLTIVSVATSMPELITGMIAAGQGSTGLAMGNIIGSNLANSALILGVAALVSPIIIQARLIRQEVPILLVVTVLFTAMGMQGFFKSGEISHLEGFILLALGALYIVFLVIQARKGGAEDVEGLVEEVKDASNVSLMMCILLVVGGSIGLAAGADMLVGGATEIAVRLNVSEVLIGLTIVAVGTSLPELAASVAAAFRKESDLIAGNIVGSNIFNILLIGGGVSSVFPIPVDKGLMVIEFPSLLLVTVLLWVAFYTDRKVTRKEGIFLVVLYALIIGLSIFAQSDAGLFSKG